MAEKLTIQERARMGGKAVANALGPEHMAEIGRRGGYTTSSDRAFMSKIGRLGAIAANRRRVHGDNKSEDRAEDEAGES